MTHGRILCGTVTTPDLGGALVDYRDTLGLRLVEQTHVPSALAASWGTPAVAGAPMALLQPTSGIDTFVRLVEQPVPTDFLPTRSFGWAAFELSVQDVFGWAERVTKSGFTVVGPPREIPGLPYFVAMQMLGRGREMIYLNEVRSDTPTSDLPKATCPVENIFIVILACADRPAALAWYRDRLSLDIGADYTIPYTMIARAFDMPLDHKFTITMAQKGRMPIIEVDGYPAAATPRPGDPALLPAGNALVTLAVERLPNLDFVSPPTARDGALYAGRMTATVRGPAGELIELVELR